MNVALQQNKSAGQASGIFRGRSEMFASEMRTCMFGKLFVAAL